MAETSLRLASQLGEAKTQREQGRSERRNKWILSFYLIGADFKNTVIRTKYENMLNTNHQSIPTSEKTHFKSCNISKGYYF